jgi:addiction module HigA family antidote
MSKGVGLPRHRAPTHPGEVLLKDFLEPMGVSQAELARSLGIPFQRVNEIVHGRRGITAETAILLAQFFGMDAGFWIQAQSNVDLFKAHEHLAGQLEKIPRARDLHPQQAC